jgi:Neocarzinostatin family
MVSSGPNKEGGNMRGKTFVAAIAALSFVALPTMAGASPTRHAGAAQGAGTLGAGSAAQARSVMHLRSRATLRSPGAAGFATFAGSRRDSSLRFRIASGGPRTTATPTIVANPSTDLLDGQLIDVTGSGFAKEAPIALLECEGGAVSESSCDLTIEEAQADKTGSFEVPYNVSRFINVNGTVVDCAQSSGCDLAAADLNDVDDATVTPISFQDVAVTPPTVSVNPSTGLLDDQSVTVAGADFTPDAELVVIECQTSGAADGSGCDFETGILLNADDAGTFSTTYNVTRVIQGTDGPVDCAGSGACVLEAANVDQTEVATTPIAFAKVRIKPVTLQVSPASHLTDGQSVTVTGKNLRPFEQLVLYECPAKTVSEGICGVAEEAFATADSSGNLQTTFDVARQLDLGGAQTDCAHAACVLSAIDASGSGDVLASSNRMHFDPKAPLLPPLELTVTIDGTGTVTAGAAELTGTVSCNSQTAVEVDYEGSVVQGSKGQVFGLQSGEVQCTKKKTDFTFDVSSMPKPFKAGPAILELDAIARRGSSAAQDELSQPVTLTTSG